MVCVGQLWKLVRDSCKCGGIVRVIRIDRYHERVHYQAVKNFGCCFSHMTCYLDSINNFDNEKYWSQTCYVKEGLC